MNSFGIWNGRMNGLRQDTKVDNKVAFTLSQEGDLQMRSNEWNRTDLAYRELKKFVHFDNILLRNNKKLLKSIIAPLKFLARCQINTFPCMERRILMDLLSYLHMCSRFMDKTRFGHFLCLHLGSTCATYLFYPFPYFSLKI